VQKLEGGRREVRGHLTSIVEIFSYPIILHYPTVVRFHQGNVSQADGKFRCDQALLVDWDWRNCDDSIKFRSLSRRCESCPTKGEPARAGSEPGDGLGNGIGEA